MRIATRMTLAWTMVGLLLFGGYGIYLLQMEERDLRQVAEREMQVLGRALQVSAESALRDRQQEDIQRTIVQLELVDPDMEVWVFTPAGEMIAASGAGHSPPTRFDRLINDTLQQQDTVLRFHPRRAPAHLFISTPLVDEDQGQMIGRLVMLRQLTEMQRDLMVTRQGIIVTVIVFVLLTLIAGATLGHRYVTRPLEGLMHAMRQVRNGQLKHWPVSTRQDTEIRALTDEFNTMVGALQQARGRLEQAAESRRQIQRGLEKADKLITIGQLSAGLAHEIGSPLQILNGRAQLMKAKADDPESVRRNADIMLAQSDRITRIVDQLLRHARRSSTRIERVDLIGTVKVTLDFLAIEAQRRGIELRFEAEPQLPPIDADPDQIQQILLNLVTNALAATPHGGWVKITLAPDSLVQPGTDRSAPAVRLSVADNGSGIPHEIHDRLFEPFFTTRPAEGGSGLGLAVAHALVTQHRGTITVSSGPGQGSVFNVVLPLSRPGPADAPPAGVTPDSAGDER